MVTLRSPGVISFQIFFLFFFFFFPFLFCLAGVVLGSEHTKKIMIYIVSRQREIYSVSVDFDTYQDTHHV